MRKLPIALVFSILLPLGSAHADALLDCPKERTYCFGYGFDVLGPMVTVKDIPASARTVPAHPDDSFVPLGNIGPVGNEDFDTEVLLRFGGTVIRQFGPGLRIGFGAYFLEDQRGDRFRRNYFSSSNPDLVGTPEPGPDGALTYVNVLTRGMRLFDDIGFAPDVFVEAPLWGRLYAGVSATYLKLQLEDGWDRFGDTERRNIDTMGEYMPVTGYLLYGFARAGVSYPVTLDETSLGKASDIEKDPTFHVGLQIRF